MDTKAYFTLLAEAERMIMFVMLHVVLTFPFLTVETNSFWGRNGIQPKYGRLNTLVLDRSVSGVD